MKMTRGLIAWALLLAAVIGVRWGHERLDTLARGWSGGFSFFGEAQSVDRSPFRLMSQRQVEEVFREHLRAFPTAQASRLARHLVELCARHELKPALVLALIKAESAFRANA